ncbi:MAG TPA: YhjD/YihY/BrkB family envelope integrity protein, partial [Candidatus Angelobacter sp.]
MAKGAAYSSILTLFPAFLVVTSVLEASHNTEGFLEQIGDAVGWVLPPGSRSVALSFLQSKQHHATRIIYSASIVTLLAATGVMISWMDGFRKAYGMANTWGFWRERAIALYLVLLALVPLGFATILVAFGTEVENWVQSGTMHLFKPLILLVWDGVRWGI